MIKKITGNSHNDNRGKILFSNNLDLSAVKRMYVIENKNTEIERAWQAHKVESRWFIATSGSFEIKLIKIDNFESPSENLISKNYILKSESLDSLIIESGYASSIKALEDHSQLLVFSDYKNNEIEDNYKYDPDKWK
jgi:dTDP-4-dehydrorhamnose 3,5-epimerase